MVDIDNNKYSKCNSLNSKCRFISIRKKKYDFLKSAGSG